MTCRTASQHRVCWSQVPHLVPVQLHPHCPLRGLPSPMTPPLARPAPGLSSSLLVHKQLLLLHQTTPNHSPDHNSEMTIRARYWKPWSHLHEASGRASAVAWAPADTPRACVCGLTPWDPRKEAGSAYVTARTVFPPESSANWPQGSADGSHREAGALLGAVTSRSPTLTSCATFLSFQGEMNL